MKRQAYQHPELRDENDNIIQEGTYGKESPLVNGDNTGVLDYINNNLEALYDNLNGLSKQQADWNVTDSTSKAFVKNKPTNLVAIGNNPQVTLNKLSKDDNGGKPVYFLMHELVKYSPDAHTLPAIAYGFNGVVFGYPRGGNGGSQFLAIVKVGLGFEYNDLYSSSGHYSPVVIKDETNNKYYWAMKINGSYQDVYMLGAFTDNPLNTVISAVDKDGNLPEGWSLVHKAKPYPLDNTTAAPTGVVQAFAGSTTPQGWLLCDGSAVSRTNYAALYAVIGTTYGAGDGSTTFNLPNLVDKFVEGSATAGTVKSAGLPNITGMAHALVGPNTRIAWDTKDTTTGLTGPFFATGQSGAYASGITTNGETLQQNLNFNASRSSSVYGNSTTVQPPALTMRYIIKY